MAIETRAPDRDDDFLGRAVVALLWGAVLGAFLTTMIVVLPQIFSGPVEPTPRQAATGAVFVFCISFVVWAAGLFIVASPFWALLHWWGFRSRVSAALLGFVLTVGVLVVPDLGRIGSMPGNAQALAVVASMAFGAGGLVVGLYIRFLAYR